MLSIENVSAHCGKLRAQALRPIQSSASALGPLGDTTTARALREQAESLTALRTSQSPAGGVGLSFRDVLIYGCV